MLLPASGKLHSEKYGMYWFNEKKFVKSFPVSGGSATAVLKFLLSVKNGSINCAYSEEGACCKHRLHRHFNEKKLPINKPLI